MTGLLRGQVYQSEPGTASFDGQVNFKAAARQEAVKPSVTNKQPTIPAPARRLDYKALRERRARLDKSKLPVGKDPKSAAQVTTLSSMSIAQTLTPQSLSTKAAPLPTASFPAVLDNGVRFEPNPSGAVGSNHLMVATENQIVIQDRAGSVLSSISLDGFWSPIGVSNVYSPRVLYDPYRARFIMAARAFPTTNTSKVLLGVSQTSDPTGNWYLYSSNIVYPQFPDSISVGFNTNWVVLQADIADQTTGYLINSVLFAFIKTNIYVGGPGKNCSYISLSPDEGNYQIPAVTYNPNITSLYLMNVWDPYYFDGVGYYGFLKIYRLSGSVTAPTLSGSGYTSYWPWEDAPLNWDDLLPQAGVTNKLYAGDSRLQSVVYRDSLYATHTIFLPTNNPSRAVVQFWETVPSGSAPVQLAQIDGFGNSFYAYPSLAVNRISDVLLAYGQFSSNQFPSASYSFHANQRDEVGDPPGAFRADTLLKAGEAPYVKTDPHRWNQNYWGGYSSAIVDPLNDSDMWTLQPYASTSIDGQGRWGLWWSRVTPPADLGVRLYSQSAILASFSMTNWIYVTNNRPCHVDDVVLTNTLPPGSGLVSVSLSQGDYVFTNGQVICNFGAMENYTVASAIVVLTPITAGQITNTATVGCRGADADLGDNFASTRTTVTPTADLAVSVSTVPSVVNVGSPITATVQVTNRGGFTATGVMVTNTYPSTMTIGSISASMGTFTRSGNVIIWNVNNNLSVGANPTLVYDLTPTVGGQLANNAVVGSTSVDLQPANNTAVNVSRANAYPTIQALSARTISEDTSTGPISFTVGDLETPAANLTVFAISSNEALIPNANIQIGGSASNRTITVTPLPNLSGTATITRYVVDGDGATNRSAFVLTIAPVNDPPTLSPFANITVNEDSPIQTVPLSGISGGPANEPQLVTITANSSVPSLIGSVAVNYTGGASGSISFTPLANAFGSATITVTVNDGVGSNNLASQSFTVTVNPVNDPPTLSPIADVILSEDVGLQTNLLSGISGGPANEPQAVTITASNSNPALLTGLSVNYTSGSSGTLTYSTVSNAFGTATITVLVNDNAGSNNIVTRSFNVMVNPVNDLPAIDPINDVVVAEDSSTQSIPLSGISSGAANENQVLSVSVTNSGSGLLANLSVHYTSPNSTGSLSFDLLPDAFGTNQLTVIVRDDGTSNNVVTRTFKVIVTPVNDLPTLDTLPNLSLNEDFGTYAVSLTGVTAGPANEPAAGLTISATSDNPLLILTPSVNYTAPANTGTLQLSSVPDAFGAANVTVTVNDGGTSNNIITRTFRVTVNPVNDLPTLNPIANITIPEDAGLQTVNLGGIGSGAENEVQSLSVTATTGNPSLLTNLQVSYTSPNSTAILSFGTVSNASGNATITVSVNDGAGSNNIVSQSFTVFITPVNDPPNMDAPANLTLDEDFGTYRLTLTGINAGPANEPQQSLSITATSSVPSVVPNPVVTYTPGSSTATLQFTSVANVSGAATITVRLDDGAASNNITLRTFTVTVQPVNDLPVISTVDNQEMDENTSLTVPISVWDLETAPSRLVLSAISFNEEVITPAGVSFSGTGTNRTMTLRPLTNQFGSVTLLIMVQDTDGGTAYSTFDLNVRYVNTPPVISPIATQNLNEDGSITVPFTVSDAVVLFTNLGVTVSGSNPALIPNSGLVLTRSSTNCSLKLTPAPDQFGSATITITADNFGPTNNMARLEFTVNVSPVNDPPTLDNPASITMNEDAAVQTIILTGISAGPLNEIQTNLILTAASDNTNVVPHPVIGFTGLSTATLQLAPAHNAYGSCTITVTANDGGASNNIITRTFQVIVNAVNDLPTLMPISDLTINENAGLQTVPLTGISAGALENQPLTITASNSNPALIANLQVNYTDPAASGTLTFTTPTNANGTAVITVTVDDHAGSNNIVTQSFTVQVNPINDPPTLNPISSLTLTEDFGTHTVSLSGISSGADNEVQTLVVTASSSDTTILPNPTVTYSSPGKTGTLRLNSLTNAYGTVTISVTVNDGGASNNIITRSFTVSVTPVNDLPSISSIGDQVSDEDVPVVIPFVIGDTETASLILSNSFSNSALLSSNSFLFEGSGSNRTVTIRPVTNQFGSSVITLAVRDADGATASTTFNLTVNPVNDPPAISAISDKFTVANTPAVVSFVIGDAENVPGDLLLAGNSSNPALIPQSGIALSGSGSNRTVTLTPLLNQTGNSTISITGMDTNGATTVSSFILTVTNGVTPPSISTLPNLTINEDTVAGPLSFTLGDLGTSVSNLVVTATSSNPTLVPPANIVLAGTGPDRTVTITPVANLYGNSTITLTVSDGASSSSTSFVLSVAPVNDPPTLNPIGNLNINQDSGLQTVALSGISSGPNENNTISIAAVSSNPSLVPNPTVNYTSPSAAGSLTFTPVAHVAGSAVITLTVNDNAGSNNFVVRTFTVTVNAVNTAPTISAISAKTTVEDTPINIPFTVSDNESTAVALTVTGTSTNTTLVPNANLYFDGNGSNRVLNVVPASNQFGNTLITLTVSDGTTTANTSFLLTVNSENDPPTLNPIPPVFLKANNNAGSTTINLTGISSGASNESQTLSITVSTSSSSFYSTQPYVTYTSPSATGKLTFTLGKNVTGTNLITVTVKDNGASNNVVRQNFLVYSRPSSATPPTVSGIANQTTAENTATAPIPFTVSPGTSINLVGLSSNPNLIASSNIVFGGSGTSRTVTLIPATNATGIGVVTVTVSDANYAGTNIQFTLTVNPVNSGPVISTFNNLTINEDTSAGPIAFTVSDSETAADDLTVTANSSDQSLVPNANIILGGSGTNRALLITPAANQSGTATITVGASDGVNSRSNSFILTVNAVNDLPAISAIADQRLSQAGATAPLAFTIGDLETAVGSLTLTAASSNTNLVSNANIVFAGSGSNRTITVTPAANQSGYSTITITVADGQGGSASTSFLLAVDPINRPPTLNAINNAVISRAPGNNSIVIPLTGISAGGENQTLNITASSSNPALVPNPVVNYTSPNSTGTLVVTAQGIGNGTATITVTVNDGQAPNNILTRTFNVVVNGLPYISNIPVQSTAEDTPTAAIPFTVSDPDIPAGNLIVTASSRNTSLVPNANIELGGSGSNRTVRVTPAAHASGSTWIDLTVIDTSGAVFSSSFLVEVLWANKAPTAELHIRRSGNCLVLSWSTNAGLCQLQARENCNTTNTWATLNVTPVINNGEYQVTVDPVGPSRLYRLLRQPVSGPLLHIRRSGNRLVLSWSTDAGLCQLQARENCNPTNTWFTLNVTPVITNGEYQVTVDPVGPSMLYRLLCQPAAAPSLLISSSSGGAVLLSWPTNYTGFTLQSCTNLTTATWTTMGVTPAISNGLNTVSVTATGALKYYRLIKQ